MKRKTVQRMAIEQVFRENDRPLTVSEIVDYGSGLVESLNPATVYRNIKMLVEDGWLARLNHPDLGALYERTDKPHHHHFHCRSCNRAFDLPGCALKEGNLAPNGFIVERHEVFLSGVCPSCAG